MKILIIGNGGAGKSTLASKIGNDLAIPIVHLDKITWKENYERVDEGDFTSRLLEFMKDERLIIEGWSYQSTMKLRLEWASIIIYLKFPLAVCLKNVLARNEEYNFKPYPFDVFTGDRVAHNQLYIDAVERVHYQYELIVDEQLQNNATITRNIFTYNSMEQLNKDYPDLINSILKVK